MLTAILYLTWVSGDVVFVLVVIFVLEEEVVDDVVFGGGHLTEVARHHHLRLHHNWSTVGVILNVNHGPALILPGNRVSLALRGKRRLYIKKAWLCFFMNLSGSL